MQSLPALSPNIQSRYIQVAATPDNSELKYTGPLFQCLATIQIVSSGSTHSPSGGQKASWRWLENTLHHATSTFSIDSLLPLDFSIELDYEDAKKEFKTGQREQFIYDEISNQWDICSLFDKDRDVENDDVAFHQPIQELDTTPTPQVNNPPTLSSDHNELGRTVVHQTPIGQDMLFGSSLEDVLYSRYGLLCSTQSEIQSAIDFIHVEESQIIDAYTICKYIMEVNLHLEHRSNEFAI
ncbi:hypothetical protein DFJ58DRAFT_733149 [Suillus subalutaceus]|uniref:uncharacterized protein n=1 Tax=Suillus subalutaceus TaxID=48586 RepID=UPI001B868E78|nr:uncharacterized protein DFJ58DRAFT_733149 [Suillus subalutaceus]KAG1839809.1 hypothetical protein DFJ58DRAFT_733149 [Suillus subalutaceus]